MLIKPGNLRLLSKLGDNIVRLSRYILTLKNGDRLMPKGELATVFKSGIGTIQTSLQNLEEIKAIQLESKGHLGTFLKDINKALLWEYSQYDYVCGTMALPYNKLLMGLATAIYTCFEESNIPLRISYCGGSEPRVQDVLKDKDDFAICSLFAAENAIKEFDELEIFCVLNKKSYIGNSVFISKKYTELKDNMNVGIDTLSYDHELLTKLACKNINVNFIRLKYNEIFRKLEEGIIDCTIWSLDEIEEENLKYNVFHAHNVKKSDIEKVGRAAIIVKKSNYEKMNAIREIFNIYKINEIQNKILEDKIIPKY